MIESVGAVVIGRNEGERLRQCLVSLTGRVSRLVYVDSGSTDGSVATALEYGADVAELDLSRPFTAARARNAGFARLIKASPYLQYVQFIDGDCELDDAWLATATSYLQSHIKVGIVCGRRRERFPHASKFNRLCDMEWDTPIGESRSCGGDALFKVEAFSSSGGYSEKLIAGEEPDLCFRVRQLGWKVVRLDAEMTLHDASMHRFSQWWQRAKRSGYADMEASRLRGQYEPELRRKVLSNIFWSLPIAWPLWPLLWLRVWQKKGALYANHIVLGKVPHSVGQMVYWTRRIGGQRPKLIEYK